MFKFKNWRETFLVELLWVLVLVLLFFIIPSVVYPVCFCITIGCTADLALALDTAVLATVISLLVGALIEPYVKDKFEDWIYLYGE